MIKTELPDFQLRQATIEDCPLILELINELAEYEKLAHEVTATVAILEESLFGERSGAEAVIAEFHHKPVGYALWFYNFSTFTGRPGIYLEDIYVRPTMRGRGFGKCLLAYLAKLAVDRNYTRVEWSVLDWNEPSIRFYRAIGAIPMDEWTVQRLHGEALTSFAMQFRQES
ncbi:MAG: GNAT family N-acetyltransferase [Gammaproteobacteria bacterium]|nr:GNAT family N-acetyltransferase [Gammaproteobacteria bacterium]MCY4357151.1 GNAT family N-acetyltransferase [Gammaproteobacteria bacterium]